MRVRGWLLPAIAVWLGICAASLLYGFSREVDPDDSRAFTVAFSAACGIALAAGLFLAPLARGRGWPVRGLAIAAMLPATAILALAAYEGLDRLRWGGPSMSQVVLGTCVLGVLAHACAIWMLLRSGGSRRPRRPRAAR